jgi:hypothetical protein
VKVRRNRCEEREAERFENRYEARKLKCTRRGVSRGRGKCTRIDEEKVVKAHKNG